MTQLTAAIAAAVALAACTVAQTGHRDLARLIHHVAHAALVGGGWAPGPGRAAVPIPRADVVAAMRTWADAGAPCPE